jgi:protein CWC15
MLYQPTKQYSSRDLPGHLKLKMRRPGQTTQSETKNKDFKKDIQIRQSNLKKGGSLVSSAYDDIASNIEPGKNKL